MKQVAAEAELTVSGAPGKTATGYGECCLFMTHFYLQSGGSEKWEWSSMSPLVTRDELCEDTRQLHVVIEEKKPMVKPIRDGSFRS